jgi:hypothetical protein
MISKNLKITVFSKMTRDKFKSSVSDKYLGQMISKLRDSITRVSADPIVNEKYIISDDYK